MNFTSLTHTLSLSHTHTPMLTGVIHEDHLPLSHTHTHILSLSHTHTNGNGEQVIHEDHLPGHFSAVQQTRGQKEHVRNLCLHNRRDLIRLE